MSDKKLIFDKIPETGTSDTYYDIINGYFEGNLTTDEYTEKRIKEAIEVINSIEEHLSDNNLIY